MKWLVNYNVVRYPNCGRTEANINRGARLGSSNCHNDAIMFKYDLKPIVLGGDVAFCLFDYASSVCNTCDA